MRWERHEFPIMGSRDVISRLLAVSAGVHALGLDHRGAREVAERDERPGGFRLLCVCCDG